MDNLKSSLKSIEHTIKCVQNAKTLAYEDLHEDREYHLSFTSLNDHQELFLTQSIDWGRSNEFFPNENNSQNNITERRFIMTNTKKGKYDEVKETKKSSRQ